MRLEWNGASTQKRVNMTSFNKVNMIRFDWIGGGNSCTKHNQTCFVGNLASWQPIVPKLLQCLCIGNFMLNRSTHFAIQLKLLFIYINISYVYRRYMHCIYINIYKSKLQLVPLINFRISFLLIFSVK